MSSYVGVWVGHGEVGADDTLFFGLAEEGFGEGVGRHFLCCGLLVGFVGFGRVSREVW